MKQKCILVVTVLSLALGAACKKKGTEQQAAKPAEGSASPASSATGSAETPTPATGSAAGSAAEASATEPAKANPAASKLLDAAKQAGSFTTFLKAVDAAGLTGNLDGPGPFTVFAPTDEAFGKLPPKELDTLLADKVKLAKVLQQHVVPGSVSSKDLGTVKAQKTIQGSELAVEATSGLKVGGANVVKPDIVASNGVIHAIDQVLVSPSK